MLPEKNYIRINLIILTILVGVFLIAISSSLWSDGMFLDGITYATISKNMSNHIGTFWNPHYTSILYAEFHEHPPLVFGIESLFFSLLGDSIYTERIYSFITLLCTCLIIVHIWKQLGNPNFTCWIPLLFYFSMPIIMWTFTNNMLENTLCIAVGLSVLFYLKSMNKNRFFFLTLSSLMIVAGILIKGPFALFVLFFPICYMYYKRIHLIRYTLTNIAFLVSIIALSFFYFLVINNQSSENLHLYFNRQIVDSFKNTVNLDNRFFIIGKLVMELLPAIIILFLFLIFYKLKFKGSYVFTKPENEAYIFLFLGLAGVVPIMISLKQRGFYIVPALMFFAISFALILKNKIFLFIKSTYNKQMKFHIILPVIVLLICLIIIMPFTQLNKVKRDEKMITDIHLLHSIIPDNSVINISPELYNNWSLHAYFARYYNISLEPDINKQKEFLLKVSDAKLNFNPKEYCKADIKLISFDLYIKKTNSK